MVCTHLCLVIARPRDVGPTEARPDLDSLERLAVLADEGQLGRLGLHLGRCNDDPRHLHHLGYVVRLEGERVLQCRLVLFLMKRNGVIRCWRHDARDLGNVVSL
jgi:hypothetical protein